MLLNNDAIHPINEIDVSQYFLMSYSETLDHIHIIDK